MEVQPFTLPCAAGWPKICGPQDERCPISINDLFDMHTTAVLYRDSGTALPKKEGSLKATWEIPKPTGEDMQALGNGALRNAIISIASKVENAADELKLCKIKMTGTFRRWLVVCCVWTAARCCVQTHLEGESGTISLLSVKFLSMDNDVSFRLPFGENI